MRLLLDTHVAIWVVVDPRKIPQPIRRMMSRPDTEVLVSVVSLWEIAIKSSRRGNMPFSGEAALHEFEAAGLHFLNVSVEHAVAVGNLAVGHADPFDRLILAQALCEGIRLVTHDQALAQHSDIVITW